MSVQSATAYTDLQGLTALKAEARAQSPEALRKVAKQFEALFLQMMLKSMRDASGGDPLFDGEQTEFFQDMHDKQLSLDLAEKGNGIGLAEMLVKQLQARQGTAAGAQAADATLPARASWSFTRQPAASEQAVEAVGPAAAIEASVPSASVSADEVVESADSFLRKLWPLAQRAAERIGAAPEALLAQAALETGWGKAVIRHPDGSSSHNLFNIKADGRWDGDRVAKQTLEYRGGVAAKEVAQFRSYGSFAESFDDYVDFLQSNPRYADALDKAADAKQFVRALQEAGYATDPSYARKIESILGRGIVADATDALKNHG